MKLDEVDSIVRLVRSRIDARAGCLASGRALVPMISWMLESPRAAGPPAGSR